MIGIRTTRWFPGASAAVVLSLVLDAAAAGVTAEVEAADARALEGLARELGSSLTAAAQDPARLAEAAEALGPLVDRARQIAAGPEALRALTKAAQALADAVKAERAARETRAGESEAALEALYRSPDWQRLGYAGAITDHWRGWSLLALGEALAAGPEREAALAAAQSAFASSARAVALPEVASASLLGLGLARLERGDFTGARGALEALAAQQSQSGREPEVATLRALAAAYARAGDPALAARTAARIPPEARTPEERGALAGHEAEQELAALEAGRGDPARAAQAIRELAALGGDAALHASELAARHRRSLAGHDVGAVGELLAADDALESGRFEEAREGYARLLAEPGRVAGLDVARARERYAVALHRSGRAREAAEQLERALAEAGQGDLARDVAKLWYAVAEDLAAREPDRGNEARAERAAAALLQRSPDAPEAPRARLRVARARERGGDAEAALRALEQVPPGSQAYAAARLERVRLRADALVRSAGPGGTPDREAARRLAADLDAALDLVAEGQAELEPSARAALAVLRAELSGWCGDPPEEVLRRVAHARKDDAVDASGRRTLRRLELSSLLAQRAFGALEEALAASSDVEIRADWPAFEEALAALERARAPLATRIGFHARLEPLAPAEARARLALGSAALLLEQGRAAEAAVRARELALAEPTWGDAWTLAARAHEASGDAAAVDLWTRVAEGVEAGSTRWIEAWLAVARTAQRAGDAERACSAAARLEDAPLGRARRTELDRVREACVAGEAGADEEPDARLAR